MKRQCLVLVLCLVGILLSSLVSLRGVAKAEAELQSYADGEVLFLDTPTSQIPVIGKNVLQIGVTYTVEISGTASFWHAYSWSSYRGQPEDFPMIPSPGIQNGKVGVDAYYVFAYPTSCPSCPSSLPGRYPGHEISLDGGATWSRPQPVDGSYHSNHVYRYEVIGQGYPPRVRLVDSPQNDNYGILAVKISLAYSISGQVTGSSNCISGATVSDGAGHTSAPTGSDGKYTLTGVPVGTYSLTATKSGCKFWPTAQPIVLSGNASQNFSEWINGISNVPLYLQGDPSTPSTLPWHPSWYNQTLLGSPPGDTIGRYGCALASYAMILSHYGQLYSPLVQTDPGDLNSHMQGLDPDSFAKYAWSKGVNVFQWSVGSSNDFIGLHNQLISGNLAMLELGVSSSPTGAHFVVATGETNINNQLTYTINDPAYGQVTLLGQYGKNDFRAAYYYMLGPTIFNRSSLQLSAHSPVELLVTDASGRRVGFDPRVGTAYNEIPNSGYVTGAIAGPDGNTLPEFKYILIPQPTSPPYSVQIIGTGSGAYIIDAILTDYSGNANVTQQTGTAQTNSVSTFTVNGTSFLFLPFIRR